MKLRNIFIVTVSLAAATYASQNGFDEIVTTLPALPLWAESAAAGLVIAITSLVFWKFSKARK